MNTIIIWMTFACSLIGAYYAEKIYKEIKGKKDKTPKENAKNKDEE